MAQTHLVRMTLKPDMLFFGMEGVPQELSPTEDALISKIYPGNDLAQFLNRETIQESVVPKAVFDPTFFADGLRLDLLVEKILQPKYAAGFVYHALSYPSTNLKVILARQNGIKELLEDQTKVEYLGEISERLWVIANHVWQRSTLAQASSPWTSGLMPGNVNHDAQLFAHTTHLLRQYQNIVVELKQKLPAFHAEPFQQLAQIVQSIEASTEFQEMGSYLQSFSEQGIYRAEVTAIINAVGGFSGLTFKPLKVEKQEFPKVGGKWEKNWSTDAILKQVTGFYEQNSANLKALVHSIGQLEFYLSGVNFAYVLSNAGVEVCFPEFGKDHDSSIEGLVNPLLLLQKDCQPVPIDFSVTGDSFGRIITGPNNGGKSVALRALGLLYVLGQSGFPGAAQRAKLHCLDGLYTHFPSRDDIEHGRGGYENEMVHDGQILKRVTPNSLALLDEPCIGTDPWDASPQTSTFVEYLHGKRVPFAIATHLHDVATLVEKGIYPGVRNLQAEVKFKDAQEFELTYKIIPGMAGRSYGEAVARKAGVDRTSLGLPAK